MCKVFRLSGGKTSKLGTNLFSMTSGATIYKGRYESCNIPSCTFLAITQAQLSCISWGFSSAVLSFIQATKLDESWRKSKHIDGVFLREKDPSWCCNICLYLHVFLTSSCKSSALPKLTWKSSWGIFSFSTPNGYVCISSVTGLLH